MQNINIATGLKDYNLGDKVTVWFNPTDPNFIARLAGVLEEAENLDKEYHEKIQNETDNRAIFGISAEMGEKMRNVIDSAFEAEVCKPLFGNLNVYAWADGLPLWANLILAIMDEMDDSFEKEKKTSSTRVKKYTEKFKKKAG